MKYYQLRQDLNLYHKSPMVQGIFWIQNRLDVRIHNAAGIKPQQLQLDELYDLYFDILSKQLTLISPRLHAILQRHEREYIVRPYTLVYPNGRDSMDYYLPVFRELDCVDERQSRFYDSSHPHEVVFRPDAHIPLKVFRLALRMPEVIIVDEDVARDIRRARLSGVMLRALGQLGEAV